MLILKVKNNNLLLAEKIVSYILCGLIPTACLLMIFGEWFGGNQTDHNGFTDNFAEASNGIKFLKIVVRDYFIFFTCQSNIFILVWIILSLVHSKKTFLLGILSNANMTIVCVFFWLGYGTFLFNFSWNAPILIATYIYHAITLALSIVVFSLQVCNMEQYKITNFKDILKYFWILPTIFCIGDFIVNFVPAFGMYDTDTESWQPGYSPYGFISAINPNIADGAWWHLIFVPVFYGLILLAAFFFWKLSLYKFLKNSKTDVITSQNKVVTMGTFLIMIMSTLSFVLLFIAQFTIKQSTVDNSEAVIGWIYGAVLTLFILYVTILIYMLALLKKVAFVGLQKYFTVLSLYYCIYTFISAIVMVLCFFKVQPFAKVVNSEQILVFGFPLILIFINSLLTHMYSNRNISLRK